MLLPFFNGGVMATQKEKHISAALSAALFLVQDDKSTCSMADMLYSHLKCTCWILSLDLHTLTTILSLVDR